eukprot:TCONS_00042828-protein
MDNVPTTQTHCGEDENEIDSNDEDEPVSSGNYDPAVQVSRMHYDLLFEKEIDLEAFKVVEEKLKRASVKDFEKHWYDIKKLLCKIQSGAVPSYRHDVVKSLKNHYFRDNPKVKIRKIDLQYSRTYSLTDDVDNLMYQTVMETFPSSNSNALKYVSDVLLPAAYKFFVVYHCGLAPDEVQYFNENYDDMRKKLDFKDVEDEYQAELDVES